ncbi:MAG: DUF938 domain-containing protein [Hyphomicrobiales bacterium]
MTAGGKRGPQAPGAAGRAASLEVAPSAVRNIPPILEVLKPRLPASGRALEIASGTGQHVCAFAEAFPGIHWTPSDADANARRSVAAWTAACGAHNIAAPLSIDVTAPDWPDAIEGPLDLICAINLIHISPWEAALGLMSGAGRLLREGGLVYLYGPYKQDGAHTAESNMRFDESLRERDPAWGVRDMGDVAAAAAAQGLTQQEVIAMPANNFSLLFARQAQGPA